MMEQRFQKVLVKMTTAARRLLLGSAVFFLMAVFSSSNASNEDSWYTKYEHYPPYCSIPEEMEKRTIPDLPKNDKRLGETRLVHVTAILRHGARTPWGSDQNCWDDYHTNPTTAIWNCNLTAYLSPPPPERVSEEGDTSAGSDYAMFLFEKRYDALYHNPPFHPLSNALNGTCQLGQLLLQGYQQEFVNGKNIRTAYVYDGNKYNHDERMRLLDVSSKKHVWNQIYYRVDDEARTLMSGQVVLRGVLGPELDDYVNTKKRYPVIPLHTADYERDVVAPNERICPRLTEIRERNEQSRDFQTFTQSKEADMLRKFQRNVLKVPRPDDDMDALDCLMTTICTDRPLPDVVNDYKPPESNDDDIDNGQRRRRRQLQDDATIEMVEEDYDEQQQHQNEYGDNLFQRLYEFHTQIYTKTIKANHAEYSKLGMGPLWHGILQNIQPFIDTGDGNVKLAVFSGHDTTIMPLLASLGPDVWPDKDWPPYASMVLLEIHEMNVDGSTDKKIFRSNYAFRLIYNGVVITSRVPGCVEDLELCDANILLNIVKPFATLDIDCQRRHALPIGHTDAISRAREILSTTEGILYFFVLVVGSALFGGVTVFVYLTGTVPRWRRPASALYSNEEDGIALTVNGNGLSYRDEEPEITLS